MLKTISKYLSFKTSAIKKLAVVDSLKTNEFSFTNKFRKKIAANFLGRYNEIETLMSIDDITSFATDLILFSQKNNSDELLSYANKLINYADNFEIDKMNDSYKKFKNIIEEISND